MDWQKSVVSFLFPLSNGVGLTTPEILPNILILKNSPIFDKVFRSLSRIPGAKNP